MCSKFTLDAVDRNMDSIDARWKQADKILPHYCEANDNDNCMGNIGIDHDHSHCAVCVAPTRGGHNSRGCGKSIRGRLCDGHNIAESMDCKYNGGVPAQWPWLVAWRNRPYLELGSD